MTELISRFVAARSCRSRALAFDPPAFNMLFVRTLLCVALRKHVASSRKVSYQMDDIGGYSFSPPDGPTQLDIEMLPLGGVAIEPVFYDSQRPTQLPTAAVFLGGYCRFAAVTAEAFAASRRSWRRSLPLRGGCGSPVFLSPSSPHIDERQRELQ